VEEAGLTDMDKILETTSKRQKRMSAKKERRRKRDYWRRQK